MGPRLRVRRDVIERASGSMRMLYERLEIRPRSPEGDEVVGYVDGQEALVGSLESMLAALNLAREDLE